MRIIFLLILCSTSLVFAQKRAYVNKIVGANPVKIDSALMADQPELVKQVLNMLEYELNETMKDLPAEAVRALQSVPIWVEGSTPNDVWLQYHFSRDWLTANGYTPEKEQSIEIVANQFVEMAKIDVYPLMEPLASAYFQRVIGLKNQEVLAAFGNAVSNKPNSYQRVEDYFAIRSDQYFRAQASRYRQEKLKAYDPQGFEMVKSVWKVAQ